MRARVFVAAMFAGLAGLLLLPGSAPAQERKVWYLEFEHEDPRTVTVGEEGYQQQYWYLLYRLSNPDGADHAFFLDISAMDDHRVIYHDSYHPEVVAELEKQIGQGATIKLWSKAEVTTTGKDTPTPKAPLGLGAKADSNLPVIRGGETRACVAVFPRWDPRMDELFVYVKGLSNDVRIVNRGPYRRLIREPVLKIVYKRPGDEFLTDLNPIWFETKTWLVPPRWWVPDDQADAEPEWDYEPNEYEQTLIETEMGMDLK